MFADEPIKTHWRPRQNGHHFTDDIFKCIFLNENASISLKISLKLVPEVRINNIPSLVLIIAWRRPGAKLLSEHMMVSLLTHTCVTGPQWVNTPRQEQNDRHYRRYFKCLVWNEKCRILIRISIKFVPKVLINKSSIWFVSKLLSLNSKTQKCCNVTHLSKQFSLP